ncbi:hypothetical protein HRI_002534700 [Hibiscus trionum]|uniref:NAC domain-containing protein n=1 Tax=Hibiscus trionum TaxID=183268 RepID=A0A9W7M5N1_HIBTR|nr:hypothetical protein HRI_002534700 [Hibiscus trionum]
MNMVQGSSVNNDEDVPLPGFRFHPTDEELVGFYLRRKVEGKTLRIDQLIKHIDIYKYDPWDLSKDNMVGESESYFFVRQTRTKVPKQRKTEPGEGVGILESNGHRQACLFSSSRSQWQRLHWAEENVSVCRNPKSTAQEAVSEH